jgi:hypothetical protein
MTFSRETMLTPIHLFEFLTAIAGGLFVVGLTSLALLCLYWFVVGFATGLKDGR